VSGIDEITPLTLLVLWGVVAFGAVVPVLPTGAAVSAAAVLAIDTHVWEVVPVVLVGGLGAYTGDLVTYGVLSAAGAPLARRLGWLHADDPGPGEPESRLDRLREQIEKRELRTLLVSRLVPGGRVPVLLVAALTGYPWWRFASAAVLAALLWSVVYAVVGIAGGSVFADTSTAIVVAMVAALLVSVVPGLVRRLLPHRTAHEAGERAA